MNLNTLTIGRELWIKTPTQLTGREAVRHRLQVNQAKEDSRWLFSSLQWCAGQYLLDSWKLAKDETAYEETPQNWRDKVIDDDLHFANTSGLTVQLPLVTCAMGSASATGHGTVYSGE